jgi:hypothetical protein
MPWMPTIWCSRRYVSSGTRERQLEGNGQASFTMKPASQGRRDSTSSGLTP